MTQSEFWPRSSGICFPGWSDSDSKTGLKIIGQEIATNSWWDLLCVFLALMISILFHSTAAGKYGFASASVAAMPWLPCLHLYLYLFLCLSNSAAQYVANGAERLQVHPGDLLDGSVLDSHPTHAKSVDHEMNSHKYNAGKARSSHQKHQKL